jgi:hypothetical protein
MAKCCRFVPSQLATSKRPAPAPIAPAVLRSIWWRRALGTSFALLTSGWRFSLGRRPARPPVHPAQRLRPAAVACPAFIHATPSPASSRDTLARPEVAYRVTRFADRVACAASPNASSLQQRSRALYPVHLGYTSIAPVQAGSVNPVWQSKMNRS